MFRARPSADQQEVKFRNPFGIWSVIGFALFLGAIILIGRAIGTYLGAAGAIIGATVVGLADVDSIAVSMANLTPAPLGVSSAAFAILAAVASNTIAKVGIAAIVGQRSFAAAIGTVAAICVFAGGTALALTLAFLNR